MYLPGGLLNKLPKCIVLLLSLLSRPAVCTTRDRSPPREPEAVSWRQDPKLSASRLRLDTAVTRRVACEICSSSFQPLAG